MSNPQSESVNAYLRTRVLTASPVELRLLLLDGAVKFARQGREGLANKNYEQSYHGITSCRAIITELLTTIRDEPNPDLAKKVRALYTFLFTEITTAQLEKDVPKLDKVIQLLEYERETWVLLMQKLAEEQGKASVNPTVATPPAEAKPAPRSLSVSG